MPAESPAGCSVGTDVPEATLKIVAQQVSSSPIAFVKPVTFTVRSIDVNAQHASGLAMNG